jgi:alanine dehydrogenase
VISRSTLLLTRCDVEALLPMEECIAAVETALRLHADHRTLPPGVLSVHAEHGGFHVKTAGLPLGMVYFAAKVNANFPANPERFGLPTIQGIVLLFDAENGFPLAVLDSIEITIRRTAAATALAARHLARQDAKIVTICGCGAQAEAQLEALRVVRPLEQVYAFDKNRDRARRFARAASLRLGLPIEAVEDLALALGRSDLCVTCTTSQRAFLKREDVRPGTFIAAVGADNPEKQELEPALFAAATVVVDLLEQAATLGDLHHALQAEVLTREDVHAELADVLTGRKVGRTSEQEITIFDSTGTALQDVAAAAAVYEKAARLGRGLAVSLER